MPTDDEAERLEALAQLASALSDERGEIVELLSSIVDGQRELAEGLAEVSARLDALNRAVLGGRPHAVAPGSRL
jgi:hypothetical protein